MTTWFKRYYGAGNYEPEWKLFETLFLSLHGPREMLMISDEAVATECTVYIGLPDAKLSAIFSGFSRVTESELPKEAILQIGDQSAFEEQFSFPSRR